MEEKIEAIRINYYQMNPKLKCLKCKKERELTEEEIAEIGKFVTDKELRANAILKYLNLADGETCEENTEHRYGWNPEFFKNITEEIRKIQEVDDTIKKNCDEINNLEKQIQELQERKDKLLEDNKPLTEECIEKTSEVYQATHTNWKKWA